MTENLPHTPKVENWEAPNNTPFTVDNALEGRTRRGAARSTHERQYSKEDGNGDNLEMRASDELPRKQQGGRGSNSGSSARLSAGSVDSIEWSPIHPQHQPKLGGRGSESPALEGKNSYDGTPGRSEGSPASQGSDTPNRGTVPPRFGGWDVTRVEYGASFPPGKDSHPYLKKGSVKPIVPPKLPQFGNWNGPNLDFGASFPPGKDPHLKNGSVKVSCFLWWWWWRK